MAIVKALKLMNKGDAFTGYYLLNSVETRPTKTGKDYLKMVLSDMTGTIDGKQWDMPIVAPEAGNPVYVEGTVDEYNGAKSVTVQNIRTVKLTDVPDPTCLVKTAKTSFSAMYYEIRDTAETIEDEAVRQMVVGILDESKEKMMTIPAAQKNHHAYLGGLLQHTRDMMRNAIDYCERYPEIKRDILLAATILHDIGKLEEFSLSPLGTVTEYSLEGQLIGHIVLGYTRVKAACEKSGVSQDKTLQITHAILAHHGRLEWGSPVVPKTLEAHVLHSIDNTNAQIDMIVGVMENTEPGHMSERVGPIGSFYNPAE